MAWEAYNEGASGDAADIGLTYGDEVAADQTKIDQLNFDYGNNSIDVLHHHQDLF